MRRYVLGLLHLDSSVNPLLFFGPFCLLIGYLIFRSSFLPRILGVLMAVAGLGWLAFLIPLSHTISPLPLKSSASSRNCHFGLWLLAMGVNVEQWKQQAAS